MDGNRFDDLARQLALGSSRRSFLKRSLGVAAGIAGIGGASASSAARRPAPTPRPVTCPGIQIWNQFECVCPTGTKCGPDCCQPGSTCCDNACCYGTCYGEELCCPTGQIVCGGVCLDPGVCCSSADCGDGLSCVLGECVCIPTDTCESLGIECGAASDNCGNPLDCGECACVPTTTCSSQGIECGPATDDCGNALSCGECTPPQTCGGGGQAGVCGCTSQMSCQGKCGNVITECGDVIECGNTCATCESCGSDNTCQPALDGTDCSHGCTSAVCVAGNCRDLFTIPCPPPDVPVSPCVSPVCEMVDGTLGCRGVPANDGASCEPQALCQTGKCANGVCVGTPIQCPECHKCTTSLCEPITGEACGDGFKCVEGGCYAFPGGNDLISDAASDGICASLKCEDACCPGQTASTCCDSMDDCFVKGGAGSPYAAFCCDPANKCGNDCCEDDETCVDGATCRMSDQVCSNDAYCRDGCCGGNGTPGSGTCCSSTQQCYDGACVDVSAHPCNSDDECLGDATCAGLILEETSPGEYTVQRQGICCLPGYEVGSFEGYICCPPGTYPTGQDSAPCCPWDTGDCPSCMCSTTSVRGWRR